ncbi:hypothetical protein J4443_00365 [Candidatus Woesearchaeota archaeon]|nr:hypothetical protein [Candidatus Woesearchaeota archaeon]
MDAQLKILKQTYDWNKSYALAMTTIFLTLWVFIMTNPKFYAMYQKSIHIFGLLFFLSILWVFYTMLRKHMAILDYLYDTNRKEMKHKGKIFLVILFMFILVILPNVESEPLNTIITTKERTIYAGDFFTPKDELIIDVYFPGISQDISVEEIKLGFYASRGFSIEKWRFLGEEYGEIYGKIESAYTIMLNTNQDLHRLKTPVDGSITTADVGAPSRWEEGKNDPPFSLVIIPVTDKNSPNKIEPGDYEINVIAIYKIDNAWYSSDDSITIHINSLVEEHSFLLAVLSLMGISIIIKFGKNIKGYITKTVDKIHL